MNMSSRKVLKKAGLRGHSGVVPTYSLKLWYFLLVLGTSISLVVSIVGQSMVELMVRGVEIVISGDFLLLS